MFPWGRLFASRRNFEAGYFTKEQELVSHYLPKAASTILVMASGNGREARPIAHMGHKIICMDNVLAYLESGQKLFAAERAEDVFFVQGNAESLPFADKKFDFIFFSIYSCLKDKRFFVIRDLLRILKPKGIIIQCTVTSCYRLLSRGDDEWAIFDDSDKLHREMSLCSCEIIEEGVDPQRPEYRFAALRRQKKPVDRSTL